MRSVNLPGNSRTFTSSERPICARRWRVASVFERLRWATPLRGIQPDQMAAMGRLCRHPEQRTPTAPRFPRHQASPCYRHPPGRALRVRKYLVRLAAAGLQCPDFSGPADPQCAPRPCPVRTQGYRWTPPGPSPSFTPSSSDTAVRRIAAGGRGTQGLRGRKSRRPPRSGTFFLRQRRCRARGRDRAGD